MDSRVALCMTVHEDMLKTLVRAKHDFKSVRGFGVFIFPNMFKLWRFNQVIRGWKKSWTFDDKYLQELIKDGKDIPEMAEVINEMNDLLVNYKNDIVGVLSYAYGKETAIDFYNIFSYGGRV